MHRLLALLIMFAFGVTQSVAAPMAVCQHFDAAGHAAALSSSDSATAAAAHGEETAAAAAEKQGAIADAGAGGAHSVLMPGTPPLPDPRDATAPRWRPGDASGLAGRSIPPLLDPPLA